MKLLLYFFLWPQFLWANQIVSLENYKINIFSKPVELGFLVSNELLFVSPLKNTDFHNQAAYVGLGSEQNYTYAALDQVQQMYLYDIDPQIIAEHWLNFNLFERSKTPMEFISFYQDENKDQTIKLIQTLPQLKINCQSFKWGDLETCASVLSKEKIISVFSKHRNAILKRYLFLLNSKIQNNFLNNLNLFSRLKKMKVELFLANHDAEEGNVFSEIALMMKKRKQVLSTLYASNAFDGYSNLKSTGLRQGLLELPTQENSRLIFVAMLTEDVLPLRKEIALNERIKKKYSCQSASLRHNCWYYFAEQEVSSNQLNTNSFPFVLGLKNYQSIGIDFTGNAEDGSFFAWDFGTLFFKNLKAELQNDSLNFQVRKMYEDRSWIKIVNKSCQFTPHEVLDDNNYNYVVEPNHPRRTELIQHYKQITEDYITASIVFGLLNLAKHFPQLVEEAVQKLKRAPFKLECDLEESKKERAGGTYQESQQLVSITDFKRHLITFLRWELYCESQHYQCNSLFKMKAHLKDLDLKDWFKYFSGTQNKFEIEIIIHEILHHLKIDNQNYKTHNLSTPHILNESSIFKIEDPLNEKKFTKQQCLENQKLFYKRLKDTVYACSIFSAPNQRLIDDVHSTYECIHLAEEVEKRKKKNEPIDQEVIAYEFNKNKPFIFKAHWWEACLTCSTARVDNQEPYLRQNKYKDAAKLRQACVKIAETMQSSNYIKETLEELLDF